ncbi:hypothetical protein BRARA_I04345 [Brassica rapa]|uniref:Uncharacterized protein n=1 Tax=Brassica campestris TaxID=3711 RepID=A0A397YAS6_BRACM|nr:hypothetical protein BRARA_I04345 [Brassica rapa]
MIEWYINNREIKNEAQVDIPLLQRGRRRVAKKDSNLGFVDSKIITCVFLKKRIISIIFHEECTVYTLRPFQPTREGIHIGLIELRIFSKKKTNILVKAGTKVCFKTLPENCTRMFDR